MDHSRRLHRAFLPALIAGVALVLPGGASAAPAPVVPCSQAGERVALTSSARLDPSCSYTAGFEITASDVDLNCRGAVIDRTGQGGDPGILVHTPVDADLSGVTIRNCESAASSTASASPAPASGACPPARSTCMGSGT